MTTETAASRSTVDTAPMGIAPDRDPPPMVRRETIELLSDGEAPIPLLFARLGSSIYVVPSDPPGAWYSRAVRNGSVTFRTPGEKEVSATVHLREDQATMESVEGSFRTKYGSVVWDRYFAGAKSVLELDLSVPIMRPEEGDRIRGEFNAAADYYDGRIAQQPVEIYLKDRVAEIAVESLRGLDPILELGPGTGYHTSRLAKAGHRILAIDISERMLQQLRARARREGWADRLEVREGSAFQVEEVLKDVPDGSFGGAFSAFGALDLESDLTGTARALSRIVRPDGRFVLTTLNRPGWSPLLWELAMARPRAAAYRLRTAIPPGGIRYPLTLYPRSPSDWDRVLSPEFRRNFAQGISVLAPPFDATRALRFFGDEGGRRILRWDHWLTRRRSATRAAEWVFLSYRRATTSGAVDDVGS